MSIIEDTQLYKYVHKVDNAFNWTIIASIQMDGLIMHTMELTSLLWLTSKDTNRHIWKHILNIYVPDKLLHKFVFMRINSGIGYIYLKLDNFLIKTALDTNSITVKIYNVPNQPIIFKSDPYCISRIEDNAMAYSWQSYCDNDDHPEILVNFPMVKSVIRAMDAIDEFSHKNNKYVLMGASKRGLTVWLTASIDPRISAIVPLVFDALNLSKTIPRQLDIYNKYDISLTDYCSFDLLNANNLDLLNIIDPYTYLQHINIPKFIINSTGDQFFLLDSSILYFNNIIEPKYLCYIPNSDHSLHKINKDIIITFYGSIINNIKLPRYTWHFDDTKIIVKTDTKPNKINLWHAVNAKIRDFRFATTGPIWNCTELSCANDNIYEVLPRLRLGWNAYFVELVYNDIVYSDKLITFTTAINIVLF